MKEQIYTIPVNEAFEAGDECPFCHMRRQAEQRAMRYVAGPGASYMEPDVRETTAKVGFCKRHTKALYDYGNPLGAALMLQTHMESLLSELQKEEKHPDMPESGLFGKNKKDPYHRIVAARVESCYLCDKVNYNMDRYFDTFFYLLGKEPEFKEKFLSCKGFCMDHFAQLLEVAEKKLPKKDRAWFYPAVYKLMRENFQRVKEDLDWMIAKYDYRNASAPWKNSKDALSRAMQKLEGIYPADPPYKND